MIDRRTLLAGLAATAAPVGATKGPTRYAPVDLDVPRDLLSILVSGLAGWAAVGAGRSTGLVWLRDTAARTYVVGADGHDLEFKFEVFSLSLETLDAMRARWARWAPPPIPSDVPEPFRRLLAMRPPAPTPPARFEPWPFRSWRVDQVRRLEYIMPVSAVPTIGRDPVGSGAAPGGRLPDGATASCDVAAGLLFTGQGGERLLIAADAMPFDLVVSRTPGTIDAFLADCRVGPLTARGTPARASRLLRER